LPLAASRLWAFTLVELMVVLAIIAMLIGLLTLTVRDGIERAKSTHCRNNLRQFGIAINKYKSDCDGYFMNNPGGGVGLGSTVAIPIPGDPRPYVVEARLIKSDSGFSLEEHQDRLAQTVGQTLGYGIAGYSPDFIQNYVLAGGASGITRCPKVDPNIFVINSPNYKGSFVTNDPVTHYDFYFADECGKTMTYAWSAYLGSRPNEGVVAFIDWNAAEGWGALINIDGVATWRMGPETMGAGIQNNYTHKQGDAKSKPAYQTEIGFHHRSGTNYAANYVAVDGHGGSISVYAPAAEFSRIFKGN
jgi:prepilin-type N-terminal cleavage/methylation domain-containing protein